MIIAGGGIYGMTLALEAARRGLQPLLIERDDFGGATSLHSLRILHGGLRYLQHIDLPRFFESVQQREWFMAKFAPLCRALPCLMPLYGKGLKRPSIFRAALVLNNTLSNSKRIPGGKVIGIEETLRRFPAVPQSGLKGAALWHDGQMLSPQRMHAELLRWAARLGATALNYVEALELIREGNRVSGVATNEGNFHAPIVINAAGPWCRELATRLDLDRPELMTPFLTFNLLLDSPPPSEAAVAVQASRMYFITPHRSGLTFAGTAHCAWQGRWEPTEAMIADFVDDLNRAIPGWGLDLSKVRRVTAGVLPASGSGRDEMAHRSTFIKHDTDGLFSVCGIKYTTAQRFAEQTLRRIFGRGGAPESDPQFDERESWVDPQAIAALSESALSALLHQESVVRTNDLLERRMDWILDEEKRLRLAHRVESILATRNG